MPFDASGNFTRLYNWQDDRNNGIKILAPRMDAEFDNVATGMNLVFFRDGRVSMSSDLKMGLNRVMNLSDGTAPAPSIKFNGDPNTGPYLDGLNRYAIAVNSTQRFVATTAGVDVTGTLSQNGSAVALSSSLAAKANLAGGNTFTGDQIHTTGNITLSAGNLNLTAGDVTLSNGNFSLTSTRLTGGTPHAGFNVGKSAANGSVFEFNRAAGATEQALVGFTTGGSGFPDGYFGTKIGATGALYFASGNGGGPSMAISANGLCVGTGFFALPGTAQITAAGDGSFVGVTASSKFRLSTSIATPSVSNDGQIAYNSVNGLELLGQGSTYDVSLLNRLGTIVLGVNTGAELQLFGNPAAPTQAGGDNSTRIATTAFVKGLAYAPLASPTFTGTPAAPTAAGGTNTTQIATTAFVAASFAPLASPTFTGTPAAPTAAAGTNTTQLATTAFVNATLRPTIQSPSASFTAADSDNNTHKTLSGVAQTLTLNSTPTAGTSFTGRFTTAWSITCTSLSKNGAATVSGGSIAAGSLITFLHEGAGTWVASGTGLT